MLIFYLHINLVKISKCNSKTSFCRFDLRKRKFLSKNNSHKDQGEVRKSEKKFLGKSNE